MIEIALFIDFIAHEALLLSASLAALAAASACVAATWLLVKHIRKS